MGLHPRTEQRVGPHPETEQHRHPSDLIGSVILGLNDGIITTLVFVLSVAVASGDLRRTIVLAGLAETLAGGVSMALGGFIAARAVHEAYDYQVDVERQEIHLEPEEERAELTEIYQKKGFRGPLLDDIVRHVTEDPERWLNVMVRDELGAPPSLSSPAWRTGLAIGISFMIGALVPLIPFIAGVPDTRVAAIIVSILALFMTGAGRARYSRKSWSRSGMEMVGIGLIGSAAGLVIGAVLSKIGQ